MTQDEYTLEQALDATVVAVDSGALKAIVSAEMDKQAEYARLHPRGIRKFRDELITLATLDQETAASCTYSIPRGRSNVIEGPSVRFAEMVWHAWGNLRVGVTVVSVDNRAALVRGQAHDLEKNSVIAMDVRRVVHKKKKKNAADEDDKQIAVAVATSIARRNAILAAVPKSIWMVGLRAAQKCADGDGTIEQRRDRFMSAYAERGATEEQVLAALGREGPEEVTVSDLRHLRGMLVAVRDGAMTMDQAMTPQEEEKPRGSARTTSSTLASKIATPNSTQPVIPHDPDIGEVYESAIPDGETEVHG